MQPSKKTRIHIVVCKDVKRVESGETEEECYVLQWDKKQKSTLEHLIAYENADVLGLKWHDKVDIVETNEAGKIWHYPGNTKWDLGLNDRTFKILPYPNCTERCLQSRKRRRESKSE